jgi:hypothetical protein
VDLRAIMQVPTLALKFESGRELKLPEKNYLIRWMAGTYCLAFHGTSGALSIIWNVQHHVTTNLSRAGAQGETEGS